MPRLSEVLKSVLVDLAQARAASDFFSADLATAYNADPVLRNLPVPRADISRYPNFSMRFSMNEVANLDAILQKWQHPVIDQAVEQFISYYPQEYNLTGDYTITHDALLQSKEVKKRQEIELKLLFLNNLVLIKQGEVRQLHQNIYHILTWQFAQKESLFMNAFTGETTYQYLALVNDGFSGEASRILEQQGPEIPFDPAEVQADLARFANAGDFDVDVDPAILQNLPDNTTSNITFSSNLRNYVWTEVPNPENNGEVELQLLPE